MRFAVVAVAFIAFALTSCDRSSEQPKSLVGATKLPSASELQKETILIARMGGEDAKDLLNIEIRPTNEVVVMHYRGQRKTPVAQERLRISSDEIERLRRMLWRLRPDDGAPAKNTIPTGCHYVYDAGWEWDVAYVREDRPGYIVEFSLPYPRYCKTPAYEEARQLIWNVIAGLPRSNIIHDFPQGTYHPAGTLSL